MRVKRKAHTIRTNIFSFKKGDGVAYLTFYIILPIIITGISLYSFPPDVAAGIYCYVTILISALNCLYDAGNRWLSGEKSKRNAKLFIIMCFLVIVAVYCLVVILGTLIAKDGWLRICDWLLFAYVLANVIALVDIVECFTPDIAWKACVSLTLEEGRK